MKLVAWTNVASSAIITSALCAAVSPAAAQGAAPETKVGTAADASGRLLLTGGVSQVEGAAGGGLTPWALIGGYGTDKQVGATGYYTRVETDDFALDSFGALFAVNNRVELSVSQQQFNLKDLGSALGLGSNFKIDVTTYGAKLRLFGDEGSHVDCHHVGLLHRWHVFARYHNVLTGCG